MHAQTKEQRKPTIPQRASLPDLDNDYPADHSWKMRSRQFAVRTSERPQDNSYGEEVGDWDLDNEGEHKWRNAEERRRYFI